MDEVIRRFNNEGVRYLVIGGQAVRLEGCPRFSMDWDVMGGAEDGGAGPKGGRRGSRKAERLPDAFLNAFLPGDKNRV